MSARNLSGKNWILKTGLLLCITMLMHAATALAGTATLGWDPPTTNIDSTPLTDLSGFKIYYGIAPGNYTTTLDVGNVTTYQVSNLSDAATYYFIVTAYDTSGNESSYSNEISKTTSSPQQYIVTTTKTGSGSGLITSSPAGITCGTVCFGAYNSGTSVILSASPDSSSIFSGWSGACTAAGTCTVTADASKTVTAAFTLKTYTITPSVGIGGVISPASAVSVNSGANQTITISPNTGYGIANVVVDGTSVGAVSTYTFTNVTANHTISASFSINTYTITPTAGTGGSISPASAASVNSGANQTITISPNSGYHLVNVLVDGTSVGAVSTYTFTNVTANHTISATFSINTYTVTPSVGTGGVISPASAASVNSGANQTITISPNTGYGIANVLVDGTSVGAVSTYTFTNVTANHTISATFSINTYTIIASVSGIGGTMFPSAALTVPSGGNGTFTITCDAGYHVADIMVDGITAGPVSTYTFSNVTTNHTISASFSINTYTITPTTGTGGAISPASAVSVNSGANRTLIITPSAGYGIADVLVDGSSVGTVSTYTFANVTANHTIRATFGTVISNITCPDPGIPCVERVDGQPDGNNFVNNKPKVDVMFEFRAMVMDVGGDPQYVRLSMTQRTNPVPADFTTYDMNCPGDFSTGALCTYRTELGPAAANKFYIEAKLSDGSIVHYPQEGYINGPQVMMLNGYNLVSAPRDLRGVWLDGLQAFGTNPTYRLVKGGLKTDINSKHYDLVDATHPPVKPGEGYFGKRTSISTLLNLDKYPDVPDATFTVSLEAGWNIISNPYGGNINLSSVQVQRGTDAPIPWNRATAGNWLKNALYYFTGSDWGSTYSFESAGGTPEAVIVPWRAYWIYLNKTDTAYSLIITKP
jgi:hypothetical protein